MGYSSTSRNGSKDREKHGPIPTNEYRLIGKETNHVNGNALLYSANYCGYSHMLIALGNEDGRGRDGSGAVKGGWGWGAGAW